MALVELFWACPVCGAEDTLQDDGRDAVCSACRTRFRRVHGAQVRVARPDAAPVVRNAAELLDRLPPASVLLERGSDPSRLAHVTLRLAEGEGVVRNGREFLNRFERFGEPREGALELHSDRVSFVPTTGTDHTVITWTFEGLTAVQPSSTTLQLKGRAMPVASFRFADDSVRLWEELLMAAIQRYYDSAGKGRIAEFQPRIVTR